MGKSGYKAMLCRRTLLIFVITLYGNCLKKTSLFRRFERFMPNTKPENGSKVVDILRGYGCLIKLTK